MFRAKATCHLETAIVETGGCAAEMRTIAEWAAHDHGRHVNAEPLVHLSPTDRSPRNDWVPDVSRPIAGLRVLDLTRVLAGPVATRFLADIEQTDWGPAHRVLPPVAIQGAAMRWGRPANKLRTAEPVWNS